MYTTGHNVKKAQSHYFERSLLYYGHYKLDLL